MDTSYVLGKFITLKSCPRSLGHIRTIPEGFRLGVNIAGSHLLHPDFFHDALALMTLLRERGITGVLEITERSLVNDMPSAVAVLTRLRQAGLLIVIDDFGTGYSALSYLQTLPLDGLKIDKSFVDVLSQPQNKTPVLDAIISLSRRLGLDVVAEGVSSEHMRNGLISRGIRLAQGYLYARPMSSNAFKTWLTAQSGVLVKESGSKHGER